MISSPTYRSRRPYLACYRYNYSRSRTYCSFNAATVSSLLASNSSAPNNYCSPYWLRASAERRRSLTMAMCCSREAKLSVRTASLSCRVLSASYELLSLICSEEMACDFSA